MSEPEYSDENTPERDYKTLVEVARARYKLACDEMDRLTAGNPGNNWRWSIPADPDRDSDLILCASADDVPRLADAVEVLQAENELGERGLRIAAHRIFELRQERDALQAQLDAIRKYVSRVPFPKPDKILAILDPVEVKEEGK